MNGRRGDRAAAEAHWGSLMEAAQDGDSGAYEKLLQEILPGLRALVSARLREASGVEDVVQNVLFSIHRARHTYQPGRPFGPWMRTIARNAVTDAHRARAVRLRREASLDDVPEPPDDREPIVSDTPLPAHLRSALDALPPNQREAVELIHIHELSVAEAAERVGIKPGALKVRAHRGYKALRIMLGGRN